MVYLLNYPRIMDEIVESLSVDSMMKTTYFIQTIIFPFFAEQVLRLRRAS